MKHLLLNYLVIAICLIVWFCVDNILICIIATLVLSLCNFLCPKENGNKDAHICAGPFIISKHILSGDLVFFEMLPDGTCGYYYKWYENCKGFRSNFYKLTTKAPEDIQSEIKSCGCYPQSQKAKAFDKILVNEYFEQKK